MSENNFPEHFFTIPYITGQPKSAGIEEKRARLLAHMDEIEDIIGYKFKDRRFLEAAFVQASATTTRKNKDPADISIALRFLGKAALDVALSESLYSHPKMHEGNMTQARSTIYAHHVPAQAMRKAGLDQYLITSGSIRAVNDPMRRDLCEAIAGAIYEDSKGEKDHPKAVRDFVSRLVVSRDQMESFNVRASKSALQMLKNKYGIEGDIQTSRMEGTPDDDPRWRTHLTLKIGDEVLFSIPEDSSIISTSVKPGEAQVAEAALEALAKDPRFAEDVEKATHGERIRKSRRSRGID
ncbi:MAG: ribonuclease III domain-containing protein [Rickettsiales bacterium]